MGCTTSHTDDVVAVGATEAAPEITNNTEISAGEPMFQYQGYAPAAAEPVAAAAPIAEAVEVVEQVVAESVVAPKEAASVWPGYGSPEEARIAHETRQAQPSGQFAAEQHAANRESIFNMAAVDVEDAAAVEEMRKRVEEYNKRQAELAYSRAFSNIVSQGGQNIQIVENDNGYLQVQPMPVAVEPQPLEPLPVQPLEAQAAPQPLEHAAPQPAADYTEPEPQPEPLAAAEEPAPAEEPASAEAAEHEPEEKAEEPAKKKKRWGLF